VTYDNSASSIFPAVVPRGQEVPELQRSAAETAKWCDRQVTWSKTVHMRLVEVEDDTAKALEIAGKLAQSFEEDRRDRRRVLSWMAGLFSTIVLLVQLGSSLWSNYRAEQRERDRYARELSEAVERARGNTRARPVEPP
jgi:hypothetical protein